MSGRPRGSSGDGVIGLGEVVAYNDPKAAESAKVQAELDRLAEEARKLAPDTLVLAPIIVTGMAEDEPKFGGWLDEMVRPGPAGRRDPTAACRRWRREAPE